MSILTVSVLGITAVLLAVQLKGKGSEYGTYIVMAAGLCLFFYAAGKLGSDSENTSDVEPALGQSSVFVGSFEMLGTLILPNLPPGFARMPGTVRWEHRLRYLRSCPFWRSVCRFCWHCWRR